MPQCFFLSHEPPHSPTHSYHQEVNESDLETQSHAEAAPCPTRFHVDASTANRGPDHRLKLFLVPPLALISHVTLNTCLNTSEPLLHFL